MEQGCLNVMAIILIYQHEHISPRFLGAIMYVNKGVVQEVLMGGNLRIERQKGLVLAQEVLALLTGCYLRAEIAGSIRRQKAYVGDAEIVLHVGKDETLNTMCDKLASRGTFEKRRKTNGSLLSWGARYKAVNFKGFAVDLFIVRPDRQWGPTMVLRTGPHEANELLVTQRQKRGILANDLYWQDGSIWQLTAMDKTGGAPMRLDTPEETDVFNACGLPYIEPPDRTAELYTQLAGSVQAVMRGFEPPPEPKQLNLFGDEAPQHPVYD